MNLNLFENNKFEKWIFHSKVFSSGRLLTKRKLQIQPEALFFFLKIVTQINSALSHHFSHIF